LLVFEEGSGTHSLHEEEVAAWTNLRQFGGLRTERPREGQKGYSPWEERGPKMALAVGKGRLLEQMTPRVGLLPTPQ